MNEEFTKQEENITKLINGNFQTTMAELKKSQDDVKELKNEMNDFKSSLQFTENEPKEKIESLEKKTWEKFEEHVDQVFSEKLGLKNIRVERAHLVERRKGDESKKPRAIICNLLSFKEKRLVMNNANKVKGTNIFIDEDYSFETMEYRKNLWD